MSHSLKDLLTDAVRRANIGRQVTAAQIVLVSNEYFDKNLFGRRRSDVRAVSFKNGAIMIGCLNSSASQYVSQLKNELLEHVQKQIPKSDIKRIQTLVMKSFPSSEL